MIASTRPVCSAKIDSIGWEDSEQKPADAYPISQQNMIVRAGKPTPPPACQPGQLWLLWSERTPVVHQPKFTRFPVETWSRQPARHPPDSETPGEHQLQFNGSSGRNIGSAVAQW